MRALARAGAADLLVVDGDPLQDMGVVAERSQQLLVIKGAKIESARPGLPVAARADAAAAA